MKSNHQVRRRGAALLLAISMMMLLALLGSTFLFVTRSYRQHSEILESRGPVELLAAGLVNLLSKEMQRDLYGAMPGSPADDGFPYKLILQNKNMAKNAESVRKRFADYANPLETDAFVSEDFWLSSFNIHEADAHASNFSLGEYTRSTPFGKPKMDATTGGWINPTSNLAEIDAVWQNTYVLNSMGQTYFVAPRVIDLCGLLNLNVAGMRPAYEVPFTIPSDLDIDSVLPGKRSVIEAARNSNLSVAEDRLEFFWDFASRLHKPVDGSAFRPFSLGDEASARVPSTGDSKTRLGTILSGFSDYTKTLVTTYSSNRNFLRFNSGGARQRINPNISYLQSRYPNTQALSKMDIDNSTVRAGIYEQMVLLIQNTTKAGHVVANLWAYCDNMDPDKDYEFTANGKTFYGVVPRPVIAEAYCYHKKDALAGTKDDSVKAYAVEIFNPTDVDVNLGEYTLDTIALSGTVSAGGYKVFYSYDAGDDADANDATPANAFQGVSMAEWSELPSLDLSTVKTLRLKKGDIPVDVLKTMNFPGYKPMTKATGGPINIQRDDTRDNPQTPYIYEGRERYNVAVYATPGGINKLGKANNLTLKKMPHKECYEGFRIVPKRRLATGEYVCPSVGEVYHLFYTGPRKGSMSLPERLYVRRVQTDRFKCTPGPEFGGGKANSDYIGGVWTLSLPEFIDVVPPDPYRRLATGGGEGVYSVQYGKISLNNAPEKVLRALPFPAGEYRFGADNIGDSVVVRTISMGYLRNLMPANIRAYRDAVNSMKTIGQVHYRMFRQTPIPKLKNMATSQYKRIGFVDIYTRWGPMMDMLTVNSDSFALILKIAATTDGLKPNAADPDKATNAVGSWRYLAVIDRSNCMNATDTPQIMLFMPLPN